MLNIRYREKTNAWPGFVDLFSNLVIILIFLLIVFVFLWTTTSVFNKDTGLNTIAQLQKQSEVQKQTIDTMTADSEEAKRLLILARTELENLAAQASTLEAQKNALSGQLNSISNEKNVLEKQLNSTDSEKNSLRQEIQNRETEKMAIIAMLNETQSEKTKLTQQIGIITAELKSKDADLSEIQNAYNNKIVTMEESVARLQTALSNVNSELQKVSYNKGETAKLEQERRNIQKDMESGRAKLMEEILKLQNALDAAEAKSNAQEIQYVEMTERLNRALTDKIAELKDVAGYQSAFYKSVKTALGDRAAIQPDGDRFIVSSDILFKSGEYKLSDAGKKQLKLISSVIKDLENKIPTDIDWIVRVDGHTDKTAVLPGNKNYKNNTELSLLRATAVTDELAKNGVSKRRLLPSGFGELHPTSLGVDAKSLQENRRIELQLTNR